MNDYRIISALVICCALSPAVADTLSLTVGGGVWNAKPEGKLKKHTDAVFIDVNDELFLDTETQGYAFVTLEHFIPIIPNARLMATSMDYSGSGVINGSFDFDGQTFSGTVNSTVSLDTLDLTAYYEVLDNVVSLDLGLSIRRMNIDYAIRDSGGNRSADTIDKTFPMIYGLVGVTPWPDLIFSGEVSYISYDDNTVSDLIVKVAYTTDFFVGFEAGYRTQTLKLDDLQNTDTDLEFSGVFAGAYLKF